MAREEIADRVRRVAEQALAEQQFVRPIDVLLGLGWLTSSELDRWRQGRVPCLERALQAHPDKASTALVELRRWAQTNNLTPTQTAYVARARDRPELRFSLGGDPALEQAYRTHWVSPTLTEGERDRLAERQGRPPDLLVVAAGKAWACDECRAEFGAGALLMMQDDGPHCLDCVDLGHLVYLPAGDAALTRRTKRLSGVAAIVVRWSRSRKRYERQGILAEPEAIARAETEG